MILIFPGTLVHFLRNTATWMKTANDLFAHIGFVPIGVGMCISTYQTKGGSLWVLVLANKRIFWVVYESLQTF